MKKGAYWVTVVILTLIFGINVYADSGNSPLEPIISATPMVKMVKDAAVLIMGSGFRPGQEIKVLYTDPNGATADIAYTNKPKLAADNKGEWTMTWSCGRYVDKKLIKEGVTSIKVTDNDYHLLAHDSILFYKDNPFIPENPPMVSATPVVKMKKDAKVFIAGSGFRPGQEIKVLYTDPNGAPADIAYAHKPKLAADTKGEWAMMWSCGRYVDKKLIKEGVTTLAVTDDEYNLLSHDSIYFYAE